MPRGGIREAPRAVRWPIRLCGTDRCHAPPQLIAELDDEALSQLFSNGAIAKGRGYVGRVGRIEEAGHTLSASVQGGEPQPYRTSVRLARREFFGDLSVEIVTRCTCPVGNRCKHAVALLMAARRPGELEERPREEVLQWATGLRKRLAAKTGTTNKATRAPRDAILYAIHCEPGMGSAELSLYKGPPRSRGRFQRPRRALVQRRAGLAETPLLRP